MDLKLTPNNLIKIVLFLNFVSLHNLEIPYSICSFINKKYKKCHKNLAANNLPNTTALPLKVLNFLFIHLIYIYKRSYLIIRILLK